jgi:hypothetical protein
LPAAIESKIKLMIYSQKIAINMSVIILAFVLLSSCSKKDTTPTPADPCAGKTIVITATPSAATPCSGTDGGINVTASGSTGFSFKLNSSGTYQSSGVFANLAAGSFTAFAKDAGGCEKSVSVTVPSVGTAGPLFTAVKNLMSGKCQGCHNNSVQNGGMNWTVDCNIVANKDRIKVRAVDQGTMPQGGPELSVTEKKIITDWINGGGGYGN